MNMPVVWRPSAECLAHANLTRLMRSHGVESYGDLVRRSTEDIDWFWREALDDLGIEWFSPYSRLVDDSQGLAWCRWFLSGKLNIAHNCVDRHARTIPGSDAVLWEGDEGAVRRLTYAELASEACRVAGALKGIGLKDGDAVGIFMPMVPELVSTLFALFKIGAVAVPVFSAFGPDALAVRLRDAGVKALFTADGCRRRGKPVPIKPAADEALRSVPSVGKVVVVRRTGERVGWIPDRDVWWSDFLEQSRSEPDTSRTEAEAVCLIQYTSGTTGKPKGAVHTHGGVLAQTAKELAYNFDLKAGERFFWLTDVGWMMGPWEIIGTTFHGGTCLIFEGAPNWPGPDRLWQLVERHRITHLGLSPTAIRLLAVAGADLCREHDLSSLRILGSTGEPWDMDSYLWYFQNVGAGRCPVINISGGTEIMGSLVACAPLAPIKACSFQGPGLGMDVDVVGEDGKPVRQSVGYLVIKKPAPSMTRGFLNDSRRYLETYFARWPGVWNHGDWATIDEDGFWFIQGRSDDTIKVAGKRTGPAEVEAALMAHPAVSEAAAIGVPDAIKGETVVCFVVLKPGHPAGAELEHELSARVVGSLGKPLRPERILFVGGLPKTRSAKIVRRAIRRRYLGLPAGDLSSVENLEVLESIPTAACNRESAQHEPAVRLKPPANPGA